MKTDDFRAYVKEQYEQVYLISNMTGTYVGSASPNIASLVVIDHGRSAASGAPLIMGGIVYKGSADPSIYGRYVLELDKISICVG
jgi:hypothetical protein